MFGRGEKKEGRKMLDKKVERKRKNSCLVQEKMRGKWKVKEKKNGMSPIKFLSLQLGEKMNKTKKTVQ